MRIPRLGISLILIMLVCALGVSAKAQDVTQVAQNAGGDKSAPVSSDKPKSDTPALSLSRVGVQTAQPLPLALQDAIRRALENNNDIEISRGDVRFQETQVRSLLGIYDPVFSIRPNYTRTQTTGSEATNDFRVGTDFSQFIQRGGGSYQLFFNNQRTENPFTQAQLSSGAVTGGVASYFSSLGVAYTQPLFRNFSIDSKRRDIIIARKRLEQTDADFRLRATDTITQVQRSYWEYVFSLRDQQNQVANVNLARENLRQIEARINAGAAAPLEKAEVETELANREGDLLLATQRVGIAENLLKQLILRDPLSSEWSLSIVPTDTPKFSFDAPSLDVALKDAMDNRFELRRLRLQQEINATDIRFFKNQTKPQIDLNSTFSLEGLSQGGVSTDSTLVPQFTGNDEILRQNLNLLLPPAGFPTIANPLVTIPGTPTFLAGGFNRSLGNLFRSDAPNFLLGVTFSFPLRNRTAKANLDGARIQEQQLEAETRGLEQTVIVEVRNAVQAVETSRQRVLTARRAREAAEIQLAGEQKLYDLGRSTTFLLFQRENALTNARSAENRAETDYNKNLADLQRVTSTAFTANNITIDSPVPDLR